MYGYQDYYHDLDTTNGEIFPNGTVYSDEGELIEDPNAVEEEQEVEV